MKRVTMHDVATHARVSVGTVSNVLNSPELVREKTRERVLKAIEEIGFIPNNAARQLRRGHSGVIGLVVLDSGNPFFAEMARGIEDAANEAGHLLIVSNSNGSQERQELHLQLLEEQRVAGVLITPAGDRVRERVRQMRGRGTPAVLLDADSTRRGECSVSVDSVSGGRQAAEHLLSLGHRRIGFVNGPLSLRQCADRREGFLQGLADGGVDLHASLDVETDAMTIGAGADATEEILSSRRRVTALFCANDLLAVGAERALLLRGHSIPDDVAIVGYDDVQFAEMSHVPLTSIRQPAYDLGYEGAQLLLEEASGGQHKHRHVRFDPVLVARASTVPGGTGTSDPEAVRGERPRRALTRS